MNHSEVSPPPLPAELAKVSTRLKFTFLQMCCIGSQLTESKSDSAIIPRKSLQLPQNPPPHVEKESGRSVRLQHTSPRGDKLMGDTWKII